MVYSGTVVSKTNDLVPLFLDGKPMHSKYNPIGESESFAPDVQCGFIVVAGIGGGFHLESLHKKLKRKEKNDFFIIAVEDDSDSLDFCLGIPRVKNLLSDGEIDFCTVGDLENVLSSRYLPAAYPGFSFLTHRAWETHNIESCKKIKDIVQKKLSEASSDFSVQSHFGKNWQRNILLNMDKLGGYDFPGVPESKTAAVIAAGPSLDKTISELKKNRQSYTIFATDTSFGTLVKNGLDADYVVSIDGQFVSSSHFLCCPKDVNVKTVFVFDLCANPSALRIVSEKGYRIAMTKSRHPLCSILGEEDVPVLESGSGTVTIAACDLAKKLGAKKIRVFGADFSYCFGKPYCKGTYLENNFSKDSSRLENVETRYISLEYRTEIFDSEGKNLFGDELESPKSSEVLLSYRKSLMDWASDNRFQLNRNLLLNKENFYSVNRSIYKKNSAEENLLAWKKSLEDMLDKNQDAVSLDLLKIKEVYPLLPYVAWLRKNGGFARSSFYELLELAYTDLIRYAEIYEKKQ